MLENKLENKIFNWKIMVFFSEEYHLQYKNLISNILSLYRSEWIAKDKTDVGWLSPSGNNG